MKARPGDVRALLIVWGGSYLETQRIAQGLRLDRRTDRHVRLVGQATTVKSLANDATAHVLPVEFVRVGQWYEHPDRPRIERWLAFVKATEVDIDGVPVSTARAAEAAR